MIWLDVTKSARARHKSGLTRVTTRLQNEWGTSAHAHRWGDAQPAQPADWYVTGEVFAPAERPGFAAWLRERRMKAGAIFHDAIPLKFPHITWPQAVARLPAYLSMLADFDQVWAISEASRRELLDFWAWQGRLPRARVDVVALGADFCAERAPETARDDPPLLLCVGILEPRKRQDFFFTVAERLWAAGLRFDLRFVGRVNPHFGKPLAARLGKRWLGPVGDAELSRLYRRAVACVFPTIAEGCGLPLLESLWHGTPCLASDLPPLRENAAGGGCHLIPPDDAEAWAAALRRFLTDAPARAALTEQARRRSDSVPHWSQLARCLAAAAAA